MTNSVTSDTYYAIYNNGNLIEKFEPTKKGLDQLVLYYSKFLRSPKTTIRKKVNKNTSKAIGIRRHIKISIIEDNEQVYFVEDIY